MMSNTKASPSEAHIDKLPKGNKYLIKRCPTKDTHDFPELLESGGRCGNCKLWEEVDAHVKEELEAIMGAGYDDMHGTYDYNRIVEALEKRLGEL